MNEVVGSSGVRAPRVVLLEQTAGFNEEGLVVMSGDTRHMRHDLRSLGEQCFMCL